MSANAYVLVTVDPAKTSEVADRLKSIPRALVREVMGPYDIIVELEEDSTAEVGRVVVSGIRSISGVISTVTCIWIEGVFGEGGGGE